MIPPLTWLASSLVTVCLRFGRSLTEIRAVPFDFFFMAFLPVGPCLCAPLIRFHPSLMTSPNVTGPCSSEPRGIGEPEASDVSSSSLCVNREWARQPIVGIGCRSAADLALHPLHHV